jgi:hypothetical protein
MTTDIVHVHWRSDRVFTTTVSTRQPHVRTALSYMSTFLLTPHSDIQTIYNQLMSSLIPSVKL